MRKASSKRRRTEKRQLLDRVKNVPCMDCHRRFPPYVMDFDHLGDKKSEVALMAMQEYSTKTVLAEIAKCDIVCANCHRIRTYGPRLRAVS